MEVEMGEYLNAETSADGDIAEFTGEGEKGEIERDGKKKVVDNIPIKVNGKKELIFSPGKKATKSLVAAWGKETKNWIGKKFTIRHKEIESFGKEMTVVRPEPIIEEKVL